MTLVDLASPRGFLRRVPTARERRWFLIVAVAGLALVLGLSPWASQPGAVEPHVITVSAAAIFVADLCAAWLLAAWYRASGRVPVLALAGAHLYGAVMAILHMSTFPGAVFANPLFGTEHTVGWLYAAWRCGAAFFFLAAVVVEASGVPPRETRVRERDLALGTIAVVGVAAGLAAWAAGFGAHAMEGSRWAPWNTNVIWAGVAVYAVAVAIIAWRRAFDDTLYLWLAIVLVSAIGDLALGNFGGGRYTLGWHASRTGIVTSSWLLLSYLIARVPARQPAITPVAAYGGALSATLGAVLLRWFLDPWLGANVPFITLFGAVAISVWLGGIGPASLSAVLGYGLVRVLYGAPGGILVFDPPGAVELFMYVLTNALIVGLGAAMRRARDQARVSEAALRERAAELQRADTNKSQFLAMLAHELRNPLAPLANALAILDLQPAGENVRSTHALMQRQLRQLTRLIDDLLDVSRIDRGKLEMRTERVAVDAVARAAIETATPGIEARGHELVLHYPGQHLYVNGDPVRLAQVLANLLNNAAKFTPPGGRIELALRREGTMAVISVRDTGVGIPSDQIDTVFEMFVQLDGARTGGGGGLGLGLTLVRAIVERHGGRVEARSAGPGKGAEFVAWLPLAADVAAAPPTADARAPRTGGGRRILVVDDNDDAASTLASLLKLQGHEVEIALDGVSGLRAAERLRPELAFIDLDMPRMDGYELAQRLRESPFGAATRLVALTGMGQAADVERTRAAGFAVHLTKPADARIVSRLAAGVDENGEKR